METDMQAEKDRHFNSKKRIMEQFKMADKTNKHHHARIKLTNNMLYKHTSKVNSI